MKIEAVKEIYDWFSRTYETDVKRKMRYTAYEVVPKLVIKHLDSKPARVLDLGCGTGLSSLLFFKAGYQVTGIDGSRPMIERAGKLPYEKLVCQNLEKALKVKGESFDAAVMIGVGEYLNDVPAVLRNVRRKLKPEGIFGLTLPQKSSWFTESGLSSFYRKEVEPAMRDAGFEILKYKRILGVAEYGEKAYYMIYLLRKV